MNLYSKVDILFRYIYNYSREFWKEFVELYNSIAERIFAIKIDQPSKQRKMFALVEI